MFDRIKYLVETRGYTIASLERTCGFANGSIRKWRDAVPSADKLFKVAELLDTTMEYLLTGESREIICAQSENVIDHPGISQKAMEVARLWDQLDELDQNIILGEISKAYKELQQTDVRKESHNKLA